MTYCIGIAVKEGLVMLTDTRTNAGIDNISIFRKLRVFGEEGSRLVGIASAGSLSTTQAAFNLLAEGVLVPGQDEPQSVETAPTMFRVAEAVGHALSQAKARVDTAVGDPSVATDTTLLVGGSIGGQAPRLFLVYGEGNFIETGMDTPYLQIGETKYGKPILDRLLTYRTPLAEAVKIGLLSMNSTMRSNLSVGLPIDMLVMRPGESRAVCQRIDEADAYYQELGQRWQNALTDALANIPEVPYQLS